MNKENLVLPPESCCGKTACAEPLLPEAKVQTGPQSPGTTFRIPTMDCTVEESEIRQLLEPMPGIRSLMFRLGARTLRIDATDDALALALTALKKAGFDPSPVRPGTAGAEPSAHAHQHGAGHSHGEVHDHSHDDSHDEEHDHTSAFSGGIWRMVVALVFAIGAETISFFAPDTTAWKMGGMAVALVAIGLAGLDTYKKGLSALLRGKLNINALMSVAVTGAFLIGQWPEAAMVMALYAIAELIEAKAVDRARNAIQGLLAMAPETALVQDTGGSWISKPVAEVGLDSIVRIRPGERVPLDGIVTKGAGAINQAPITGESIPVDKQVGDPVFAGTINETGELEFRVTSASGNTTLARIIHAVEEAQGTRAPTQRFVDRFASIYTPAVFAIAVAVAVLTPFLLGITWLEAIYKALVLLVIACPCALVISTPVTVVSGLSAAARRGILIKGGTYLENARLLNAVALDKTGTITEGKPKLVAWRAWGDASEAAIQLQAAAMAARSDHPVSKAIHKGLEAAASDVEGFKALPGRGTEGVVAGQRLFLGNLRLMEELGLSHPQLEAALIEHEQQGHTLSLLADETRVLGIFAVADTIKESSRQAIADLKALGVASVMLTGDNVTTAQAIGHQAGIADVRGDLLPEAKLEAIKHMQKRYGPTGMTGDGINDAPALAQADVGFAMGGAGTDTAMEAADVVIMNDNLMRVAETVRLSKRTHHILWQNISLALGIKSVFFLMAVFGTATMWMAVFADMGASLLVVGNGLRLLRGSPKSSVV